MTRKNDNRPSAPRAEHYHDVLFSALTHDIVGPLGFCANLMRAMLRNGTYDPDTLQAVCETLEQAKYKADGILELLRSKTLVNTGTLPEGTGAAADLGETAETEIETLGKTCLSVCFVWERKERALTASHPVAVHTAVQNILSNAAKYCPDGKITMKCYGNAQYAVLEVENKVKENAQDIAKTLSDEGIPTRGQRASIGIFISRALARMCGGDITLRSGKDNDLLCATLCFPRHG